MVIGFSLEVVTSAPHQEIGLHWAGGPGQDVEVSATQQGTSVDEYFSPCWTIESQPELGCATLGWLRRLTEATILQLLQTKGAKV